MRPVVGLCILLIAGCSSAVLPLCPEVAGKSYPVGQEPESVNYFVAQRAADRGIEISELSFFVAEFRGFAPDLTWLQRQYPHLLCAFDPRREPFDRDVYTVCVAKAPRWMEVVVSERPQDLMAVQNLYREVCASETERAIDPKGLPSR